MTGLVGVWCACHRHRLLRCRDCDAWVCHHVVEALANGRAPDDFPDGGQEWALVSVVPGLIAGTTADAALWLVPREDGTVTRVAVGLSRS